MDKIKRITLIVLLLSVLFGCGNSDTDEPKGTALLNPDTNSQAGNVTNAKPEPDPEPKTEPEPELELLTIPGLKLKMIPIKPGIFMMGDKNDTYGDTRHKVKLTRPFWIGETEVTRQQWEIVMGVSFTAKMKEPGLALHHLDHCATFEKEHPSFKDYKNLPDYPMCYVSWMEAIEFCNKLTLRERRNGRLLEDQEYRLPTEAEWAYSCRAGSEDEYCFGDDASKLDDYAWYQGNSKGRPQSVAKKKPNAWGLYDMHGSLWEWCSDRYESLLHRKRYLEYNLSPKAPKYLIDPEGPATPKRRDTNERRVIRGGDAYDSPNDFCRSATREGISPSDKSCTTGFRIVRAFRTPAPTKKRR